MAKLSDLDPLSQLDVAYATRDLFEAIPRLEKEGQATAIDYIEMRIDMWRKANCPKQALAPCEVKEKD